MNRENPNALDDQTLSYTHHLESVLTRPEDVKKSVHLATLATEAARKLDVLGLCEAVSNYEEMRKDEKVTYGS